MCEAAPQDTLEQAPWGGVPEACRYACRWSMSRPKYMWMEGSRWLPDAMGFHAALIIYNTADGIAGVEMLDNGTWCAPRPPLRDIRI